MKIALLRLLAIATSAMLPPSVCLAASFSVALPGLVGRYESPDVVREAGFDLEVAFEEIHEIVLRIDIGEADPGGLCTTAIPSECTIGSVLGVALASTDGIPGLAAQMSGLRQDSASSARIGPGFALPPSGGPPIYSPLPDFILSGRGRLSMELLQFTGPGVLGPGFRPAEILSATLTVRGVAVPEPQSALWAPLMLLLLSTRRPTRRCS